MTITWALLIYTVPAQPSRLRATVWRELKRVGATYLRDGVCVLPEGDQTLVAFQALADQVEALGGKATVVSGARLGPETADEVIRDSRALRSAEYAELARDARGFLDYVRLEARHRELGRAELARLERDLGKLRTWLREARSGDHFEADGRDRADALLGECARELASLSEGLRLGRKAG
jgi:hypothetical protein